MSTVTKSGAVFINTTKKIRHSLSTGLSFIDTSINNLSGSKPDRNQAIKIYQVGLSKLRAAIADLDQIGTSESTANDLGYNGTVEEIYTSKNEEVSKWTTVFENHVRDSNIFAPFAESVPVSLSRAKVVGSMWYEFSSFMPWFLCQAASKVSTNEKRHYVIQTAFEELGMRDVKEIHPEMFWDAATIAGVDSSAKSRFGKAPEATDVLNWLKEKLLSYDNDEKVLGILLGLEIPAIENIETVFDSLAHTPELRPELSKHKFFYLHRQIEVEHVRLTVSNFLRFCPTVDQQANFIKGFFDGLEFWKKFWETAGKTCLRYHDEVTNAAS